MVEKYFYMELLLAKLWYKHRPCQRNLRSKRANFLTCPKRPQKCGFSFKIHLFLKVHRSSNLEPQGSQALVVYTADLKSALALVECQNRLYLARKIIMSNVASFSKANLSLNK